MLFLPELLIAAFMILHPFYISMTDINYNGKAKSLEVSVRIFTDDFEKTLAKNCNCKIDLINPSNKKEMEQQVSWYIVNHLQIKVNGQIQSLELSGYQQEAESTWNYFEIKNVGQVKKIEINNTILHDYKEEQINMLHIKANGKDFTDKLDFPSSFYERNF
jgi:hypothetical protein